jgi:hypothetical protein
VAPLATGYVVEGPPTARTGYDAIYRIALTPPGAVLPPSTDATGGLVTLRTASLPGQPDVAGDFRIAFVGPYAPAFGLRWGRFAFLGDNLPEWRLARLVTTTGPASFRLTTSPFGQPFGAGWKDPAIPPTDFQGTPPAYALSGPTELRPGVPAVFTIDPNATLVNTTVTPTVDAPGFKIDPPAVKWSNSPSAQSFTLTPPAGLTGPITVTAPNSAGLLTPDPLTLPVGGVSATAPPPDPAAAETP